MTQNRRWNPLLVYVLYTGLSSLLHMMVATASVVYQVDTVGLTPLQLVLVGTTLEVSVFICEVPTGVVADVYSRRLSVIIGTFLIGAGFVLVGAIPAYAPILAGQVLWGVGYTFTSGATEAWVADEVGESKAGHAFVRGAQAGQLGAFVGILAGAGLGSLRINLPILLGGGSFAVLGVLLILVMPEHNFRPAPAEGRNTFGQMLHTARAGVRLVRLRPILYTIFGVSLIWGIYSEGYDRLSAALLMREIGLPTIAGLQPVVWIGLIDAGALLLGAGATELARRRVDADSRTAPVRLILYSNAVTAGALIVLGLTGRFGVALAMSWLIMPLREMTDPFHLAWLNRQLQSNVRATAISLSSQTHALGEIVGGPLAGAIATAVSLRASFVAAGLVLVPSLFMLAVALRAEARGVAAQAVEG